MNYTICKICNENIRNNQFKRHIEQHNISQQNYYDKFFGKHYCPVCGKETKFKDVLIGYNIYCSRSCLIKSSIHCESVKLTKTIRYGNPYYTNPEKCRITLANKSKEQKEKEYAKVKATKLERYGNETYNNSDKYKETCLKRYGTTSTFAADSVKKKISDKYQSKSDEEKRAIYAKRQATFDSKTEEEMLEIGQKHREAYLNKSDEEKDEINHKRYLTKKKNHSFKVSKIEDNCYSQLLLKYPNAKHSYKSILYPFVCDFYIPEIDLYIELNFHWTHGGHPYDKRKDKDKLDIWKEKAKKSKYFENAINTWTIRDVYKVQIANQNNINLLVFYNNNDFDTWLSMQ